MNSYENGKIYLIKYKHYPKIVYVGRTISGLKYRFIHHKSELGSLSEFVREHCDGDWSNWYIELYENFPCENRKELETREGEVQLEFYNKKYYLINTHISRNICFNIKYHNYLCDCGHLLSSKCRLSSHKKSKSCSMENIHKNITDSIDYTDKIVYS